ncbi:MAG: hypothetical protein WB902_10405 [Acetobacteraceae bacterium]|jgi:hypothetical protein
MVATILFVAGQTQEGPLQNDWLRAIQLQRAKVMLPGTTSLRCFFSERTLSLELQQLVS